MSLFTTAWLSTLFCGRLPALTALAVLEFVARPGVHRHALIRLALALLRLSQARRCLLVRAYNYIEYVCMFM